jgi:ATP-dependent RNA helicase DDX24/MAK5
MCCNILLVIETLRCSTRREDEIEPPEAPGDSLDAHKDAENTEATPVDALQTFVFSATLSKDLQKNLKRSYRQKGYKKLSKPASTLGMFISERSQTLLYKQSTDDLLLRLDFRDSDPTIIDISPEGGVVSTLKESKIECLSTDKVRTQPYMRGWRLILHRMHTCTTSCYGTLAVPSCSYRLSTASGVSVR